MFQTFDDLDTGRVFWRSIVGLRPVPYDCVASGQAATLTDGERNLVLVVAPTDDDGDERKVFVQLRDVSCGDSLLDVTLDERLRYLDGTALGSPVDEVGAADALRLIAIDMGAAQWEIVESGDDTQGDDDE